jgi:hypothetical protein
MFPLVCKSIKIADFFALFQVSIDIFLPRIWLTALTLPSSANCEFLVSLDHAD